MAAGKTATREGARYRKLARSRGKAKAQVALGNTQLKVYHKLLSSPGMRYRDLGPDYYERQAAIRRKIAYHVREIETLGLDVTLTRPAPEPGPDEPASTPGRLTRPQNTRPTSAGSQARSARHRCCAAASGSGAPVRRPSRMTGTRRGWWPDGGGSSRSASTSPSGPR